MSLHIEFSGMKASTVGTGNGIDEIDFNQLASRFVPIHRQVMSDYEAGKLPFWDLPFNADEIENVRQFAGYAHARFTDFVHLGIGGSALGPIALHQALNHPQYNLLPSEQRNGCRFFCPDNVDPDLVNGVLDIIDPKSALFNVVSKSGGTAETISQFMIILDLLKKSLGDDWRDHLVLTTDLEKGFLRDFANREGIQTFPIPSGVGGRFTVLTAVGLLPAALTGIDIRRLCAGAGAMKAACLEAESFEMNPAAQFAGLLYHVQTTLGKPIHVMFAYSNRLYPIADWFRQMWAESLGKKLSLDGEEIFTGPTPVKAIGATDQHSQVQLYVEGPPDKAFIFLGTKSFSSEVDIPAFVYDAPETGYLAGSNLSQLLNAEKQATLFALTEAGRPCIDITFDRIDPEHVGALLYMLEAATLYAGGFYNVNPLDQPGVEAGKKATYALMGRPGYEAEKERILKFSEGKSALEFSVT